jgi:4-hydroxy-tetrahydrodipicolinate synthase
MSNDTTLRLAPIDNIVGIKDATGNIGRGIELLRAAPGNFAVYSGDDATAMALMFCGGAGNISVTANVAPRAMHDLCAAAMAGDTKRAIEINNRVLALHARLFVEPNPVPVKWALAEMGMMPAGLRLPLAPLSEQFHDTVRSALVEAGVYPKA